MRIHSKSFIVLFLAFFLGTGSFVYAGPPVNTGETGRFIIIADDWTVKDQVISHTRGAGGNIISEFKSVPGMAVILPTAAIQGLANNPHVKEVGLDTRVYALDAELDNSWGIKRIGAGAVHSYNKASGVKVAVIDTGIDYTHPDLGVNFAGGYDFVNNDSDPMDDNNHGTHVSGIIAALDNDAGVVGAGPQAGIYALKVLDASGGGYWSDIINALDWASANNIQVVNMSFGASSDAPGVHDAIKNAYNAGTVLVAAAGNSGNCGGKSNTVGYPARYEEVVAVGATDQNDLRPCFSSHGDQLELAAPGLSVISTVIGGGYASFSGTSMASPHVAGTAALVLANGSLVDQNGDGIVNNVDVRLWLQVTADDIGPTGKDNQYGYGLVDADEAAPFTGPVDSPPLVSITNPLNGTTLSGTVTIAADASDDDAVIQVDFYLDGSLLGSDATGPYEWVWDSTAVTDGSHAITATAIDTASQSTSDTAFITVDNVNDPPVADAGADQSAYTGDTVYFDGSGSTDDRGIVSYSWNFGDDATASGVTASHVYQAVGIYTVILTATDAGALSANYTLTVTVSDPPAEATQVIVDSVSYSTEGGKNQNLHLRIAILVVDDFGNPVGGASVSITLNHDSVSSWSGTGVTDSSGKAEFKLNAAPSGCYTTTITDVSTKGLTWDGITPTNGFCK